MNQWQPRQHDPNWHSQGNPAGRPPATPPQWQQSAPARQYHQPQPQFQPLSQPQPRQYRQPQYDPPRRSYAGWIAAGAVALVVVAGAAFYMLHGKSSSAPGATGSAPAQAAVQPETEAGVRADANQFYALYSAGQWAQAWQMLAPASQKAAPEATYAAVHEGCPSATAGLARVIKSVTMAGSTAVVTETVGGVVSSLGSVTDAWSYAGGRWGITLSQSSTAPYSHGSAAADVASLKAAGQCAS